MAVDAFGNIVPDTAPGMGALPAVLPQTGVATGSKIDPALVPYLTKGLQRAEQLFFGAQPSMYAGQMYVSPSAQTQQALAQQEAAAGAGQQLLGQAQQSYLQSLGQVGQTAAGGFLTGSPYQQAMIQAATRPLTQQFGEQVLPGVASLYSRAGRYGSGAMERALGGASEAYGRALGDVTTGIVAQDYARERQNQLQAQLAQAQLAQAAPGFFQASLLPSQTLAQVGAAQEAIAAQPLQEQIQRFQYQQQLPYSQLQSYLSSIYGTPMASSIYPQQQTATSSNRLGQAVGGAALGYLGGGFLGSTPLFSGVSNQALGAGVGGLLGYFL